MKNYLSAIIITVAVTAFTNTAAAAWGNFDTTFGFLGAAVDGNVTNHFPQGIAVQSDGKILVTGYRIVGGKKRFFLRRYLSNGQVDTSFGNNGSAIWNTFIKVDADYFGQRIVVQPNGRIAVAGVGNQLPTIWRFLSSGSADISIGSGGMKTLSAYAATTTAPQIATFSNILYVGLIKQGNAATVVIKFNSNGTQDTSFGTSGEATTDAGNAFSLTVDPASGNILIGGRRRSDPTDYGLERFMTTGILDPTFNHWNATYEGDPQGPASEFVRLANGQFVLNERWHNLGQGAILFGANIVRLSSNGAFTSRSEYQPAEFYYFGQPATGTCPDLTTQQADGRVILAPSNFKKLYRFSTNFATIQTMTCGSYANLDYRTPAVLQSDDKMIGAGTYNGYITLVRTLP